MNDNAMRIPLIEIFGQNHIKNDGTSEVLYPRSQVEALMRGARNGALKEAAEMAYARFVAYKESHPEPFAELPGNEAQIIAAKLRSMIA